VTGPHTQDHGRNALLAQVAAHLLETSTAEEARILSKHPGIDREELRYALDRLSNKPLHLVLRYLREHPDDSHAEAAIREIFGMVDRIK
jgi:hypothetical protein